MTTMLNHAVGPRMGAFTNKPGFGIYSWLYILSIGLGMTASTQMFAYIFEYQDILGWSVHHYYAPWKILEWVAKYHDEYPQPLKGSIGAGLMVTAPLMLGIHFKARLSSSTPKGHEFIHGSARWAKRSDIEAASLLDNKGVYIGAWIDKKEGHRYLQHNGPEHVLCFAPTRSGKGVGLVVPTLLTWTESAVILDLKGELWEMSAGYRKSKGHKVLRFDPASQTNCIGFNPLEEIRMGTPHEVGDVQNLATLLVDPDGKGLTNHWQLTAQSLIVGVILHLLYKSYKEGKIAHLPALDAMLSNPKMPVEELWKEMLTYPHKDGQPHPAVAAAGRDMLDRSEEEAGGVLSSAKSCLSLYRDPVVARNVSKSEFKIRDLMNHADAISLYIVTQPNDKMRLRPLVRILINMIFRLLADRMEFENGRHKPHYKHRLLMMLDEFASLGKLEIMQESLAFVAGYGIKCYIIIQDITQLKNAVTGYGMEESITSNCHIQLAFPPNRLETAEYLSKLTGQTTIVKEQITTSGKRFGAVQNQVSRTMQEVPRALLTVDESMRMEGPKKDSNGMIKEPGEMVIYCAGFPAIRGEQPLYFQDPEFLKRSKILAPRVTDKLMDA
jgi:type IV secretion system protein VirD4